MAAPALVRPRGHKRSTRTRAPSFRATGSYTRLIATRMSQENLLAIIVKRLAALSVARVEDSFMQSRDKYLLNSLKKISRWTVLGSAAALALAATFACDIERRKSDA